MRCYGACLLTAISAACLPLCGRAAPASSHSAVYGQPDGSKTPELFLRGDERYAWLSDPNGYTVTRDSEAGWYVYARKNDDGRLEPLLEARVGKVDPVSLGLQPNLRQDPVLDGEDEYSDDQEMLRLRQRRKMLGMPKAILCDHEGTAVDPCYMKQLALLVRFAGHESRNLPSPEDINVLFNNNGPTGTNIAPTGSIADAYRANSFDTFVLDTHVSGWQQISKTEEYCSGGKNGFNLKATRECWAEALKMYSDTLGKDGLSMFDGDNDGYIDGMVIVHSGAPAETNGEDCETGAVFNNRIWSHAVPQVPNFEITNEFSIDVGVKTGRFYVFSAVFGVCPESGAWTKWEPGRIAIAVHEAGHFLGLKDLYGQEGYNRGIGNWGFMGNSYGWDTSGHYPGLMSGYSRHLLGWLDVVDITYSQEIAVTSSCDSDKIYRIAHRMASDEYGEEYFLIENRQACGHDVNLKHDGKDRQGIIIFHVDHTGLLSESEEREGVQFDTGRPPSDPEWPMTHAVVSILQGDGAFDLEKNENRGDETDSFRVQGGAGNVAKMISNDGVTTNTGNVLQYPNTKSIAYGEERETGITIEILDKSQNVMRVRVTLLDENGSSIIAPQTNEPMASPTDAPVPRRTDVPVVSRADPPVASPTDAPVARPTDPPRAQTTNAPVTSPTVPFRAQPADSPRATSAPIALQTDAPAASQYSCDNSPYEEFEFTGLGDSPELFTIRQCLFIKPDKRDPVEWCNTADFMNNSQPVSMKCQRECSVITGCPPPDPVQRHHLRH